MSERRHRPVMRAALASVVLLSAIALAAVGGIGLLGWATPRISVPPLADFQLADVTIVNPGLGREAQRTLRIEGRAIAAVTDAADPRLPTRLVGGFVLPGLVDMHVHFLPAGALGQRDHFAFLLLAHGVTAVRDAGWIGPGGPELARAIEAGALAGPRLFSCGPMLDGSPRVWPTARTIRDPEEGRRAVEQLAAQGVRCIKVYSNLRVDVLEAISETAHRHGLPVVGHLPRTADWALRTIDDVQHVCDPRCWGLGPEQMDQLVRAASSLGLAHTPTLVVYAKQIEPVSGFLRERAVRLLPRLWRDVLWDPRYGLGFETGPGTDTESYRRAHEAVVERVFATVRRLHEAGVRLHAGSDPPNPWVIPGASLHEELELLTRAGLTPEQALETATSNPARFFREPRLGVVRAGAFADLAVFRDDPTADLRALSTLEAVVADGRFYSRAELEAQLDRRHAYFTGFLFDRISTAVARVLATLAAQ